MNYKKGEKIIKKSLFTANSIIFVGSLFVILNPLLLNFL